ncbi:MAG: nucleotidyltransferase family protein [Gemmatimonadota bacterium]
MTSTGGGTRHIAVASAPRSATISAAVLAAGLGRRFGGNKLMASLDGRPVLAHVLACVAAARDAGLLAGGVAVLPPHAPAMAQLVREAGLRIEVNPHPELGLASSLRAALKVLARVHGSPPVEAALIVLGDQPRLDIGVIARLITARGETDRAVIRPRYAARPDEPGHPLLVARSIWPLAESLGGDRGLGELLRTRSDLVHVVPVGGANPDIDTPADLAALEDPSTCS